MSETKSIFSVATMAKSFENKSVILPQILENRYTRHRFHGSARDRLPTRPLRTIMKILCLNGIFNFEHVLANVILPNTAPSPWPKIDAQVKQLGKDLGGHLECFTNQF